MENKENEMWVSVSIPKETIDLLTLLVDRINQANAARPESLRDPVTHDIDSLLGLMAFDLGEVVRRPGSWEGANMKTVLEAHGLLSNYF